MAHMWCLLDQHSLQLRMPAPCLIAVFRPGCTLQSITCSDLVVVAAAVSVNPFLAPAALG